MKVVIVALVFIVVFVMSAGEANYVAGYPADRLISYNKDGEICFAPAYIVVKYEREHKE